MATTLPGSPYVESSDLVAGYPGVSESLAERVDTVGVLPFADSTARGTALPSPTEGQYTYLQDTNGTEYWDGTAWVAAGKTPGFNLMTPTSIANTGGSASASGGAVTFTGVSSISLNGCFTSEFTNYRLVVSILGITGSNARFRMRSSGTDDTGANYADQYLYGSGSSSIASRETGQTSAWFFTFSTAYEAVAAYDIGNPQLAKQTTLVGSQVYSSNTVELITWGVNHNQATAYDGITFLVPGGSMTGTARIYGYQN